jgi:hypothetical protein
MKTHRLAAVLAAFCCVAPVVASSIPPVTEEDLVRKSELIFQGVVMRIDHRKAGFRTTGDATLPHTFVTFQVERILKGKHTGSSSQFTLRQLGGPDYSIARFLEVEGCPDFDIGERAVVFVRRNERGICPMTGWSQGKFRIVNGSLFNDSGREVWLTKFERIIAAARCSQPSSAAPTTRRAAWSRRRCRARG